MSWPLSCGMARKEGAEKGTGRKFLPRRTRIPRQTASFKGLAAQSACPGLSCGVGCVIEAEKGGSQKFLPRRNRIPLQMASFKGPAAQRTCPAVLWRGARCRGPRRHRLKFPTAAR